MPLPFASSPELTLGVELELQLLDRETRDLSPACGRILERLGSDPRNVRPELFQSMLEVSTGVCRDLSQVRRELEEIVATVRRAAESEGVELASCGRAGRGARHGHDQRPHAVPAAHPRGLGQFALLAGPGYRPGLVAHHDLRGAAHGGASMRVRHLGGVRVCVRRDGASRAIKSVKDIW